MKVTPAILSSLNDLYHAHAGFANDAGSTNVQGQSRDPLLSWSPALGGTGQIVVEVLEEKLNGGGYDKGIAREVEGFKRRFKVDDHNVCIDSKKVENAPGQKPMRVYQ